MNALCQHTLLEFYDCDPDKLRDSAIVKDAMLDAVRRAKGTIITDFFHNFAPQGCTGVVVISESHVTIHTWPEHRYAALDIFSCSRTLDHNLVKRLLTEALSARRVEQQAFERGRVTNPVA